MPKTLTFMLIWEVNTELYQFALNEAGKMNMTVGEWLHYVVEKEAANAHVIDSVLVPVDILHNLLIIVEAVTLPEVSEAIAAYKQSGKPRPC